jgi:hypothetical protein
VTLLDWDGLRTARSSTQTTFTLREPV